MAACAGVGTGPCSSFNDEVIALERAEKMVDTAAAALAARTEVGRITKCYANVQVADCGVPPGVRTSAAVDHLHDLLT